MTRLGLGLTALLLGAALAPAGASAADKKCLFVSSYHQGYAWSDGVERGLRSVLEGECEIRQFDMDTKRRKSTPEKKQAALEAKALIESWQPDIVIAADDNAAKYLIQPYYRNHTLPFVFCGVNWTADEYGFPYSNVTGMIEVAPIGPMLERAKQVRPNIKRAFYLGADTLTEQKNLSRFQDAAAARGFELHHALTGSLDGWLDGFAAAQSYDLLIMGSRAGITDWDDERARAYVSQNARTLSVTNHGWMMPITMIGVTKVPEEQGEWAAKTALRILGGMAPSDIPIVPNSQRDIWINHDLLAAADLEVPVGLMRKGKKVVRLETP
ncbi:MAG: hypothetical protein QNJ92_16245 [Alphaproteobacteria bacterium]|nr:hypothetical protein [Alphaproteobacteria bacterium]